MSSQRKCPKCGDTYADDTPASEEEVRGVLLDAIKRAAQAGDASHAKDLAEAYALVTAPIGPH